MQTDKIKLLHKRPRESKKKKIPKSFYLNDYSSSPLHSLPRVTLTACMLRCLICVRSTFSWPSLRQSCRAGTLIYQGSWRIATPVVALSQTRNRGAESEILSIGSPAPVKDRVKLWIFEALNVLAGDQCCVGSYGNPENIPAFHLLCGRYDDDDLL